MKFLGDELSADPFELLLTRVTELDLSPLESAADLYRHAESGFGLGGDSSQLRGRIPAHQPAGLIGPHPVFRLANRQPLCDHDLQAVLLRRLAVERDERTRVTCGDGAGRDRRLDGGAAS